MVRRLPNRVVPAVILSIIVVSLFALAVSQDLGIPVGEEQVVRGASAYAQHCASCHGQEMEGFGPFPELAGSTFRGRWADRPLSELYTYVRDLMPLGMGGSLSDDVYADIVASLLRRNGVVAGEVEFSPEDEDVLALPITFGN